MSTENDTPTENTTTEPVATDMQDPVEMSTAPEETITYPYPAEKSPNSIPVVQQLVLLASILFLLLGGALTPKIIALFSDMNQSVPATPIQAETKETSTDEHTNTPPAIQPFKDVSITAEAAFVWDVQTQRALYKKNESEQLPLASVTKLMTALVASELLDAQSQVTISDTSVKQYGDSGLRQGESFDRETLTDLVLMSSSNDGAYAMASAAGKLLAAENQANTFVRAMNIRAQELGLTDTYYRNPTGLDISDTEGGAYGSAKDMAFLMEYLTVHAPDILNATRQRTARVYNEAGVYHDVTNTNYYIDKIPGLIGSKTGYTELAGGNLVISFDAGLNRPIIIAVLGSTRHDRFTDVLTLVQEAQKYVAEQ